MSGGEAADRKQRWFTNIRIWQIVSLDMQSHPSEEWTVSSKVGLI